MSTTKACKNHFPVLLCTTQLAQNTFQYYFVLQSLHKTLPINRSNWSNWSNMSWFKDATRATLAATACRSPTLQWRISIPLAHGNCGSSNNRRKFRSQTSDNMDRWKAEMERIREKRKIRREKSRRERVRRKKMQMREKVGKSRNTVFFQWFVAPEGRKVGSLKRRVRSQLARWVLKNCTPLWREAHFEVKMYKTPQLRTTFGNWDIEKVHAAVARSTFPSQNVQSTTFSDHFWKFRCRKSARRCGAKHVSKSKCTKHTILGPLLEVQMSKKCTPLWREAHFQVKMYKTHRSDHFWKLRCWKSARRCCAKHVSKSKCAKHTIVGHFWKLRCRKSARRCGAKHISKSKCTKHHMFAPLLEVQMSFRVAGARDCAPCQKWPKREGFVAFPRMMAGMGHLKICKHAFSWQAQYKRHVHERC